MRIAVFSDIHGNEMAFRAALADLSAQGDADQIWLLGDYAAAGPRPAQCVRLCLELLQTRGKKRLRYISGNTDRYLVHGERKALAAVANEAELQERRLQISEVSANLDWTLAQLSWEEYDFLRAGVGAEIAQEQAGYGWCYGYHAVPGDDEAQLRPETPDDLVLDFLLEREGRLGIGGHIHQQYDRRVAGWRLLNPGSVGCAADYPGRAAWALLDFKGGEIQLTLRAVPYDTDAYRQQLAASGFPNPQYILSGLP